MTCRNKTSSLKNTVDEAETFEKESALVYEVRVLLHYLQRHITAISTTIRTMMVQ